MQATSPSVKLSDTLIDMPNMTSRLVSGLVSGVLGRNVEHQILVWKRWLPDLKFEILSILLSPHKNRPATQAEGLQTVTNTKYG